MGDSIQRVAKGGGCVSLYLSARAKSPFVRRGRSEVIRMKHQPGPWTWTWIGKSDPIAGRTPYSGSHRHIFIIYLNLPTQYNNSHVIPRAACVARRGDTWRLYKHGHRIMDWALS